MEAQKLNIVNTVTELNELMAKVIELFEGNEPTEITELLAKVESNETSVEQALASITSMTETVGNNTQSVSDMLATVQTNAQNVASNVISINQALEVAEQNATDLASATSTLTSLGAALNLMTPGTKRITFAGDSHTDGNINDDGSYRQRGYLAWFNALSKGRFKIAGNHGWSGQTTEYIDSQMDTILAEPTDILCVLTGSNDYNNTNTLAELLASAESIIDKCLTQNVFPIFTLLFPREFDVTAENHAKARGLNDYLRAKANAGEIGIFNTLPMLREGLGNVDDDKFYDLVHLDYRGAYVQAYGMVEKMKLVAPNSSNELISGANNLFPNPDLTGTNGGLQNNVTGQLATDLYCDSNTDGVTVTVSMGPKSDLYANNAVIIDVSVDDALMTDDSAYIRVQTLSTVLNNAPHIFAWDVEIENTLGFSLAEASVQSFAAPTFTRSSMSEVDSAASERLPVIDDVTKLRCITPEFTPDGTQAINTYMFIRIIDGAGRIILENPTLIEV